MANTPFDVIMAFKEQSNYPANQDTISTNREHVTLHNYTLGLTDTLQNGLPIQFMNREIGEDVLYLENWNINRPVNLRSADTLIGGTQLNPYYEYPNQSTLLRFKGIFYTHGSQSDNVIFSKEQPLSINSNTQVNLFYKSSHFADLGISGNYDTIPWVYNPCDSLYSDTSQAKKRRYPFQVKQNSNGFLIYPNPTSNKLNIEYHSSLKQENVEYSLFDFSGSMILNNSYLVKKGWNKKTIPLPDLPTGIYYLQLKGEQQQENKKLVIH